MPARARIRARQAGDGRSRGVAAAMPKTDIYAGYNSATYIVRWLG
jgi:hypothetical protein